MDTDREERDSEDLRNLMGLGTSSIRKSYYPELQKKIDELNREKEYINDIINSMPSMLIGIDSRGIITRWNRKSEEITSLMAEEAVGRKVKEVLPHLKEISDSVEQGHIREKESSRFRLSRRSGDKIIHEEVSLYKLTGNGSEDYVLRIDDVTEQVLMQEAMVQSEKILSIGGLAAGMAHEINNPLAGIMQTAAVLEKRLMKLDLPANRKAADKAGITTEGLNAYMTERGIAKMLLAIGESGKRASGIIRNMLRFSRGDDKTYSTHDPVTLIDRIVELAATDFNLKKHYDFRNIKITKVYGENLIPIPCSESQIQQVILNLLRNGAEAMNDMDESPYEPRFIIRLRKEDSMLRIEIEDNGPGIPEGDLKRVFEPFYTTKPPGVGTGLGLSVSHYIITNNHKGTFTVEPVEGGGSKFIIRLPLMR